MKQNHRQLFRKLVEQRTISSLCSSRSTFNISFPTAGGKVFWESCCVNGWKLQVNSIFGNWRILDPYDERQTWGLDEKQLESFLNDRPTSFAANYLDAGYAFSRYAGDDGKTAVLIHGWGVRSGFMKKLALMLRQAGYSVLNYDYPSSKMDIVRHAEAFLACYRQEHLQGEIHFLTHSMGGLILRHALARMTESECRAIDSIVLLGPPNHGSALARLGKLLPVSGFHDTLRDMIPGSEALRIPPPKWLPPVGIIAGKFDLKVSAASTRLPDGLPFLHATVCCSHPGLRNPRHTGSLILRFFQHKNFNPR